MTTTTLLQYTFDGQISCSRRRPTTNNCCASLDNEDEEEEQSYCKPTGT
ncbi:hypothetical protein T03_9233 [Trichinella britovi]|uniref:Uncharacterized protein n=1 Tax=Trichinella britovi TaxID=45882 RepID=A0A0V0Z7A2_TRIBR|nr:hypothetical protein T03_9233 [Trichinella britovi]